MRAFLSLLDQLRRLLETATSLEGRLVISGVVVLFALIVGALVTPYLVRRARDLVDRRLLIGEVADWADRASSYVTVGVGLVYVVRFLQLVVLLLTGVSLLVVWGLVGLARRTLSLAGQGLPLLFSVGLTVGLVVAAYVAVGFLDEFIDSLIQRSDTIDEHQGEILYRVGQVSIIVLAATVALAVWKVDLGGLLVGAGFLGIVVGMAARQTLGSVIAGFVLMFSKPFEVGDWIEVDDHEGIVTDISIVNTRLENFDGEYVVIPNDVVSNRVVVNRTRKGRLRIRLDVGIDYSVDPERAETVAMDALTEIDEVMAVPRPQVIPKVFGDSSIGLELRFWIDNPSARRKWRAKAAVVRAIYTAFEEANIKIPYPQRELSGRQEAGGFRIADGEPESPADTERGPEAHTED